MSASVLKLIYKLRSEVILNYGKELWFTQIMFNILKQLGIITANDAQDTPGPCSSLIANSSCQIWPEVGNLYTRAMDRAKVDLSCGSD